jgi:hypothetical protein
MADPIFYRNANLESPGWSIAAVTPNDATDLPKPFARITASGAGNVHVIASGGGQAVLGIAAGGVLPVFVDRVLAASTTATGIVAIYGS